MSFGSASPIEISWPTLNDTGTIVPGSSGSVSAARAVANRIRWRRAVSRLTISVAVFLRGKLAEELFDVLDLQRALLEIVLRDVILHRNSLFYMITRRQFLQFAASAGGSRLLPDQRAGKPRGSEFVFARLRYDSGDWDYNPKVAANVLNSIVQHVDPRLQKTCSRDIGRLRRAPVLPVRFHDRPQAGALQRRRAREPAAFADNGGLLFSDDCNHDVNGLYAKSFEQEARALFP